MISTLFKVAAGTIACASLATPSFAGVYANVENNSGFSGGLSGEDFGAGTTDLHLGFEGNVSDAVSLYVQGGPQIQHVKDADSSGEYSGKVGGNIAVTERLGVYGEIAAVTNDKDFGFDSMDYGTKIGAKFNF